MQSIAERGFFVIYILLHDLLKSLLNLHTHTFNLRPFMVKIIECNFTFSQFSKEYVITIYIYIYIYIYTMTSYLCACKIGINGFVNILWLLLVLSKTHTLYLSHCHMLPTLVTLQLLNITPNCLNAFLPIISNVPLFLLYTHIYILCSCVIILLVLVFVRNMSQVFLHQFFMLWCRFQSQTKFSRVLKVINLMWYWYKNEIKLNELVIVMIVFISCVKYSNF